MTDIANRRLIAQQIAGTTFKSAKEIIDWMGAMQAQDYAMAKWAIGVRLPNSTGQSIEAAIDNGDIIRTHVLRPTWHFVSAENLRWMLALTASKIQASSKSRHAQLGISANIATQSNTLIEKALSGGKHLTRETLIAELRKAGIATDENRASHLFAHAELEGMICSGATKAGKQTYALLKERIPKTKALAKEEALAKLARLYFTSHGPATLQDFIWWSGLSVGDARQALELVKSNFVSETIDSKTYWFVNSYSTPNADQESVYLLPAFDEFLISYTDRRASLIFENHTKAVSSNGIFWPIIVVNGQVIGTWKRTIKKDQVLVETEFFIQTSKTIEDSIEKEAIRYGDFLGKKTEVNIKSWR